MRLLIPTLFLIGSISQAAQVTLRQGEIGQLGSRRIEVVKIQDQRCGINEDCPYTVTALIRVWKDGKASLLTLQFPKERALKWSGIGISNVDLNASNKVTFTNQPIGGSKAAQQITLKPGETGHIGSRQIKFTRLDVRRCQKGTLCTRPVIYDIQIQVKQGASINWLYLEYPNPPAWPGISLIGATYDSKPKLTFSDEVAY